MKTKGTFIVAALLGLAVSAAADDSPRRFVSRDGKLAITCPLTIGGNFVAESTSLSGELTVVATDVIVITGNLESDLATLDTGIGLRNRHLTENYLEIGKGTGYEKATLSDLVLKPKGALGDGDCAFTASLLVHGVQKSIAGTAKVVSKDDGFQVAGSFPLRIPDFAIAKPRHLGIGVKDEIAVRFEFLLEPAPTTAIGGRS